MVFGKKVGGLNGLKINKRSKNLNLGNVNVGEFFQKDNSLDDSVERNNILGTKEFFTEFIKCHNKNRRDKGNHDELNKINYSDLKHASDKIDIKS